MGWIFGGILRRQERFVKGKCGNGKREAGKAAWQREHFETAARGVLETAEGRVCFEMAALCCG